MNSRIIVVGLVIFCMAAESRLEHQSEAPEIFSEGYISNSTNHVKTSRIVGRKGAENPHQEDNSTVDKSLDNVDKQIASAEVLSKASAKELSPTERVSMQPSGLNDSSAISDVEKHQLLLSTTDTTTAKTTEVTNVINESSASKRNYIILCISLALTVLAIALASVMYRKIRNWIELRHYTRVVSLNIF